MGRGFRTVSFQKVMKRTISILETVPYFSTVLFQKVVEKN